MDVLELNQFPAVAAGGLATLVTDELHGMSLHGLVFEQGGTTFDLTHLDDIEVSLDGKDLVKDITGVNLQAVNTYNGIPAVTNYLAHFFGDPTARTIRGQHLGDLDLSLYDAPLNIKVKIGAGAVAPELQCYAIVGPPKLDYEIFTDAEAFTLRALLRSVVQPTAAVNKKSFGIGLGSEAGARLRAIHFFHTALTSVEFRKSSFTKWDNIKTALNSFVQTCYARTPAAGHYVLDRIFDSNQGEAETTLDKNGRPWPFRVNLTTTGTDTIETYADVHTALPLI